MKPIRYIIVDDERLARVEMKLMMQKFSDFICIGEAKNAKEAETLINLSKPDLLFLDIQMPGRSGFELLADLTEIPAIIFTTAFDQYALKAFEANALDYLLKPVRIERLEKALQKINIPAPGEVKHLFIKENDKFHIIKKSDVIMFESIGNYVRLHLCEAKVFYKKSLNQLSKLLPENDFFRINRSRIININYIKEIEHVASGQLLISLSNGDQVTASSRQSAAFKSKFMK